MYKRESLLQNYINYVIRKRNLIKNYQTRHMEKERAEAEKKRAEAENPIAARTRSKTGHKFSFGII